MNWRLLLLFSLCFATIATTKPTCDYDYDLEGVSCKDVVNVFPTISIFDLGKKLQCQNCHIKTFSAATFNQTDLNFNYINISNSKMEVIDTNAFKQFTFLNKIFFENNKITNISRAAFKVSRAVTEISLKNNSIVDLKQGFAEGIWVVIFSLENNKIEEIPNNVFKGITRLMRLNLSHNKIKIINYDSFDGLDTEELYLNNNELCYIPRGVFRNFDTLRILDLSNNKLTRIPEGTFSGLKGVEIFILKNVSLEYFNGEELLPMNRLFTLDITDNKLHDLDAHLILSSIPSLSYISIENNFLNCSSLANFIRYFNSKKVGIHNTGEYDVQNLKGIPCIEGHLDEKQVFMSQVIEQTRESAREC